MAYRQMHLNKAGSGFAAKTACGRNILRTPMSTDWAGFTDTKLEQRCVRCDQSTFAAFKRKNDWIPEAPDAWIAADAALIAKRRLPA